MAVWDAYIRVKRNDGGAGVDAVSLEMFEEDLKNNLYKIWNRMSSGSYFPPPVRTVLIPKSGGTRTLGIPTVADRIAQMTVKLYLEPELEPVFDEDSYGYRPGKSALDALNATRSRCWQFDWVLDLDIKGFFDNIDHDRLMRMLRERIDDTAFLDLIRKWLKARVLDRDGKVIHPESGTSQGGIVSPVLANIYLHFGLDLWFERKGETFIKALNRRLRGHYNYYNVPGNLSALWRSYSWAEACAFKWLNGRGGKRKSFTLKIFTKAIDLLGIAKPKMRFVNKQHRVFT